MDGGPTTLSLAPNSRLFQHTLPIGHGRWASRREQEDRGGQILTAMPWPKPEPGCGLAALM